MIRTVGIMYIIILRIFSGVIPMSGHNKWSQIKHKKAKEDAKKGKAFTKLIKEITVSARESGGDPAMNPRLRLLLEKAKEVNMPIDNANRAIKRGTGELPGSHYEQYVYEGYGPHGIAVMVDTLSDSKNRTVAELRHAFSANGGNLAEGGAVSWMFTHAGVIRIPHKGLTEDTLLEKLLDFNVLDIRSDEESFSIICDPKSLDSIKKGLEGFAIKAEQAELEWIAQTPLKLSDEHADKAVEFLSEIQDLDDVQNVYTNLA
jgi:YebC/PmpR family DNA-binding regulatory protein